MRPDNQCEESAVDRQSALFMGMMVTKKFGRIEWVVLEDAFTDGTPQ